MTMNESGPTQGPAITSLSKPREVTQHFTKIMEGLQAWRSEDHEDNITLGRNTVIEIIEGVKAVRSQFEWHPIETAPKDGSYVWVSNGFSMRVAFWANGKQFEHRGSEGGGWRDLARAENGGAGDMMFAPAYWQPLPKSPHWHSEAAPPAGAVMTDPFQHQRS